ncbi:MAG: AAA family ATPase [Xenococcaceae cyanobacterium MO_167.B52]|nr:AAA family ATPase [Xenococcaceae cyanobacterium MO_167.B52]
MTDTLLSNFREAYRNLTFLPLIEEEEINKFKVKYGTKVIEELQQLIEDSYQQNSKVILAGHRGCGKSTLLAELKRQLDATYFVTFFSISDLIEMSDVNHINILFAIAVNLMEEAEKQSIKIKNSTKENFYQWFAEHTQTNIDEYKAELETGFNFNGLFAWIKGVLKTNSTIRDEIKIKFERRISELVNNINQIATVISVNCDKPILVIIDDIDKIDIDLAKDIFQAHIKALFQPNFNIVMTIPIAALREVSLVATLQTETNDQIVQMPVSKLYQKGERNQPNAQPNPTVKAELIAILNKRIQRNLIEQEALEKIVIESGGVLRELIRITNECCRICLRLVRREPQNQDIKINLDILDEAINKLSLDFDSRIGVKDYEILKETYENFKPNDPKEQQFLDLLHGLYILEYRNHELWYDVHPIVVKVLQQKNII